MNWEQVTDPLHHIYLSALVAVIPTLFIFWALIIKRMKGYRASLLTAAVALCIALFVYHMPAGLAALSMIYGSMYGLFPICWIILPALFLFNITVASGQFEVIKNLMGTVTTDRRLQVLLIAFSFGSFLEGTAGFATPVVITSAMLFSLGFDPLYAAGICLIANTAPVAFGSVGIPIIVASHVSGIPEMAISQMVGRTLPFLSLLLPFYLVTLMVGFKKSVEVLPATLVSGLSFAFFQWFCSNYMGPMLPDIIAGIASIVCLMILLRYWKPKTTWRFKNELPMMAVSDIHYTDAQILKAWTPFIILTLGVIGWGLSPVKLALNAIGEIRFSIPGLHNAILSAEDGMPLPQIFHLNYLSASGTAMLIASLISIPLIGFTYRKAGVVFISTIKQLKYPAITICSVLAFAYITNNSGMSNTMALAISGSGFLFPFFAPILGWLGVFITGSDTSSNALFVKLQHITADKIGVDPVITVAANCSGGVVGKMISPQSIAVAAASGGLTGNESRLFRFTVMHSFIMLTVICFIVLGQAYVFKWMTPFYSSVSKSVNVSPPDVKIGYHYLIWLACLLALVVGCIRFISNKKTKSLEHE